MPLFRLEYIRDGRKRGMTFHASCSAMAALAAIERIQPLAASLGAQPGSFAVKPAKPAVDNPPQWCDVRQHYCRCWPRC